MGREEQQPLPDVLPFYDRQGRATCYLYEGTYFYLYSGQPVAWLHDGEMESTCIRTPDAGLDGFKTDGSGIAKVVQHYFASRPPVVRLVQPARRGLRAVHVTRDLLAVHGKLDPLDRRSPSHGRAVAMSRSSNESYPAVHTRARHSAARR